MNSIPNDASITPDDEPILWESVMHTPPIDAADKFNERLLVLMLVLFLGVGGLVSAKSILEVETEPLSAFVAIFLLVWTYSTIAEIRKNGWYLESPNKDTITTQHSISVYQYSSCQITRSTLRFFNGEYFTKYGIFLSPSQVEDVKLDYFEGCPALRIDVTNGGPLLKIYLLGQHDFATGRALIEEYFVRGNT